MCLSPSRLTTSDIIKKVQQARQRIKKPTMEKAQKLEITEKDVKVFTLFAKTMNKIIESSKKRKKTPLKDFLGTSEINQLSDKSSAFERGNLGINLKNFLSQYTIEKITHVRFPNRQPTEEYIQLSPTQKVYFNFQVRYYVVYAGEKLVVDFEPEYDGVDMITIFTLEMGICKNFFNQFEKYCNVNHVFKKRKLELDGPEIHPLNFQEIQNTQIILAPETQKELNTHIFNWTRNREEFSKVLPWKRGIILEGEPGCGKTSLGKFLCNEFDQTVLWITTKSIDGAYSIGKIFKLARKLAPVIIFFEDIDFIANTRYGSGRSDELGELLSQLDGVENNEGLFVIATTNNASLLDTAISQRPGRFDAKIQIPLPTEVEIKNIIKLHLKKGDSVQEEQLDILSKTLKGFTPAFIKEIVVRSRSIKFSQQRKLNINYNDLYDSYQFYKMYKNDATKNKMVG